MTQKYLNTIMLGDATEKLKELDDDSIDLIFADPPYFMQTTGTLLRFDGSVFDGIDDEWDKFDDYEAYDQFSLSWLKECKRVLKKDGSLFVIGSFQNIYRIGYHLQNLGFWFINDIIWNKKNPVPNFAGTRLCNAHETILWVVKNKNAKFTFNYKTLKALNNNKQERSVWDIAICSGNERLKDVNNKKLHSTQKPYELLEKIVIAASKPNDIVLDPFLGTGTTAAAAKYNNRNWIGIEKDPSYVQAAFDRINAIIPTINDYNSLKLETKPPRISIEQLIAANYLFVNETLYSKDQMFQCKLLANGKVVFEDNEPLSIHKMSAFFLNQINHNGWDYFYVLRDNHLVSINDLRYQYVNNN
ncbi:DNA-methyltransferase [Ureaplasma diversum]|uniref:Methyltransferase n=1 Tax=Ureaplasma diversum NCTC 246 TaxID=1188241 RepID=A0A084F1N9_9BACT|nr:site-specific DNA-methyltransferase [Ureaplasma diversum]KEZ24131.1 N4-cytosine or N6-adenine DNAmethyltransferase [Ureaplasma diversum NCTC 246]